jgi:hypothetical protein
MSDPKHEGSNLDIVIVREKMASINTSLTSIGSTVVENLTSDPKFEGSNLDIVIVREEMA